MVVLGLTPGLSKRCPLLLANHQAPPAASPPPFLVHDKWEPDLCSPAATADTTGRPLGAGSAPKHMNPEVSSCRRPHTLHLVPGYDLATLLILRKTEESDAAEANTLKAKLTRLRG